MKRYMILFFAALILLPGCNKDLIDRIDDLDNRIDKLEELCSKMNEEIESVQQLVASMDAYIKVLDPIRVGDDILGYILTMSDGSIIKLVNGRYGNNGSDGKDGYVPEIGIKRDEDGVYYWTVDGEWMRDDKGGKIRVFPLQGFDGIDGKPGDNGKPGNPGRDGSDVKLQIEDGYWWLSYDGETWNKMGKATGTDGADGKDAESIFSHINHYFSDYVVFIMSNGTEVKIPTWAAFEKLQSSCNKMNTNLSSLSSIMEALSQNDYVKSYSPIFEGEQEVGYEIVFANSGTIRVYHGKDGVVGEPDPTPVVGSSQDTDGVYYWTLNGEWILDESGNKLRVKGQDGPQGEAGADGITPMLRIEGQYWQISYDNGRKWTTLGKAVGEDGKPGVDVKSPFRRIVQQGDNLLFVLQDNSSILVPLTDDRTMIEQISSIVYIPRTADGKTRVIRDAAHPSGIAEMDFMVYPSSVLPEIEAAWEELLKVKASYVFTATTRSVSFFELPVVSFHTDLENGMMTVGISGESLSEEFYNGMIEASAFLSISDLFSSVTSEHVVLYAEPEEKEPVEYMYFRYISTDNAPIAGSEKSNPDFWSLVESNEYDYMSEIGIIKMPLSVEIPASAFCGIQNLKMIEVDSRVRTMDISVFEDCNALEEVILPPLLEEVSPQSFMNCKALRYVSLPANVKYIGETAFQGCAGLETIELPSSVLEIRAFAFKQTALKEIVIPQDMKVLGPGAFADCKKLKLVDVLPTVPPEISFSFLNCPSDMKIYVDAASLEAYKASWSDYARFIVAR